ncbi:T9SS type A sorting domain-containing protein [Brumimicrobium oceani]|uniref:Secretion system C-terminal sorting domain-containing protein n=1 Tax=Brumimicrobium oceani TaxID=2100725 RepID=A0A2U2XDX2_9FLAO|nr:T9SS type A sorting domain-containing protein [Brumimicrobium oceani]PWH86006.1 hypothetical protein DIT68_05475 [Brumimicrobium oceani]
MKMLLFFFSLFFLIPFVSNHLLSQNWAPVGATWYFEKNFTNSFDIDYTKIEVEKDTVVLGLNCSKLLGNFDGCMWNSQFMYESNDSIYFYHPTNNKFEMLFDFGAAVGDVWKIPNYTTNFGSGGIDTTELLVDSLGIIMVSGENLRVVYTSQINASTSDFEFGGTIIEKIGANYMFPSFFACDPVPGDIRCYSDGMIDYSTVPFACDAQAVGLSENQIIDFSVSPNPFNSYFEISSDQNIRNLKIKNMQGQNISYEQKGNRIFLNSYPNGIYLLTFEQEGRMFQQKLIKE